MISSPCDFSQALALMKSGMPMRRIAWEKKRPIQRKTGIWIFKGRIRSQFVNYVSDNAVLGTDDILAEDWIPFDEATTSEPPKPLGK